MRRGNAGAGKRETARQGQRDKVLKMESSALSRLSRYLGSTYTYGTFMFVLS